MPELRAAEWINVVAFLWSMALAWKRRDLDRARRNWIAGIGAGGLAITLAGPVVLARATTSFAAPVVRDWIPVLLLVLFYWQGGLFVTRVDAGVEAWLERVDRRLLPGPLEWCARRRVGAWILGYLELAYFSYYLVLPLAMMALYLTGAAREADRFWAAVLAAGYGSCAVLPFVQTRPPRVLGEKWRVPLPAGRMRAFNLWILRRGSVQANTFPSVHVAVTMACALMMLRIAPEWMGLGFLWIAVSVALGAVAGRYHYAMDAVLGALAAVLACAAEAALYR